MRAYFSTLGESAHPYSTDPRARAITRFQELLLVSFREFSVITDDIIHSERRKFRVEIVHSLESFSRRAAVRNIKTLGRFTKDQAGLIYDALYKAMCICPPPPTPPSPPTLVNTGGHGEGGGAERIETRIGLKTFRYFLSEVATWARDEKIVRNGFQVGFGLDSRAQIGLGQWLIGCTRPLFSKGSIGKWRNTSLLIDYSISGMSRREGCCLSK